MSKRVSTAEAKAHFAALVAEAASGERVIIEKRGKPVAALVSLKDLVNFGKEPPAILTGQEPKGLLDLLGVWADIPDEVIDKLVEDIYAQRERDVPRPVELEP